MKLNFLETGCTFCMVFRKPASTAPYTAGRELGHVSPFCLALLSGVGQARGKKKRASQFLIQDPSLCKLPRATCWAGQPARVTAQLMEQPVLGTFIH